VNKLIELFYIVAAAIGLWGMRRKRNAEAWGILAVVGYFWFMSVLVLPILRYMVPATAVMLLAVAVMVESLGERWARRLLRS
jgi:hypothetical protein